jgi:hypothetical protein
MAMLILLSGGKSMPDPAHVLVDKGIFAEVTGFFGAMQVSA